jgi:hypothetical protein
MGTRTDNRNSKKINSMAQIYRGLIDIFYENNSALKQQVTRHVRSFDRPPIEDDDQLYEMSGFWRIILELIVHTYTQVSLNIGIVLISLLVVATWPIMFLVELFSAVWYRHGSHQPVYYQEEPQIDPKAEADTSGDGKVVRRMVYEETKVKAVTPRSDKK